ncbi:MAG: hypothetical protein ACM31O_03400 [Bacteroidota bacterium]
MSRDLTGDVREQVAEILQTIARDGLPGPRDLDVALEAIGSTILDAEDRNWKAVHELKRALREIAGCNNISLTDDAATAWRRLLWCVDRARVALAQLENES